VDLGWLWTTMWGMGKKEIVTITDDIDGRAGAETVTFAYAGRSYEIDLGEKNKAKLEKALEPLIGAARKAGGNQVAARKTSGRSASRPTSAGLDRNAVRRWAAEQGIEVAKRGRLAKNVVEAFLKGTEPSRCPRHRRGRGSLVGRGGPVVPG
jgi:hypothetical protein